MQIVIKISEENYKNIKEQVDKRDYPDMQIGRAIADGIPLPKGHGRIADMDEAIKCIEDAEGEDAIWAIGLIDWACGKRTIIEADREIEYGNDN